MFPAAIPNAQLPAEVVQQPQNDSVVKKVALKCLKEFSATLAFNFLLSAFVITPAGTSLLITATVVQFAVSLFFHSLGAFAAYKRVQEGVNQERYEKLLSFCQWMTGTNFVLLTGYNVQTLIHETGHAAASLLTYANPRPQIEIFPFEGGLTQFNKSKLSLFGKRLGAPASNCLLVASGPALTLLVSSLFLAVGVAAHKKHPSLSKYLIIWGVIDFLNHAHYAYSALTAATWNLTHDFVRLSIYGLNPVVATIALLVIPIVIGAGVYYWKCRETALAPA